MEVRGTGRLDFCDWACAAGSVSTYLPEAPPQPGQRFCHACVQFVPTSHTHDLDIRNAANFAAAEVAAYCLPCSAWVDSNHMHVFEGGEDKT